MSMVLDRGKMIEPYYEIHINGSRLKDNYKKFITEVEVEECDTEADLGRVTVSDVNFEFTNNVMLTKKTPIKIFMGFKDKYRLMLSGQITHIEADFGDNGVPTLVIGAIDNSNKMTSKKKSRVFKDKTVAQVVNIIAKEYGFKTNIQPTETKVQQLTQEDETDAQFLTKLAEGETYKLYLNSEKNELYFGEKIANMKLAGTLHYNSGDSSIRTFSPTLVEKNREAEVESKSSEVSSATGKTSKNKSTVKNEKVKTQNSKPTASKPHQKSADISKIDRGVGYGSAGKQNKGISVINGGNRQPRGTTTNPPRKNTSTGRSF